jgi:hypothetical protein
MRTLSQFTKLSLISPEDHAKALAADQLKAQQLYEMRGVNIPRHDVPLSAEGGIPIYESRPDLTNVRGSARDIGASKFPGAPAPSVPGPSPLRESEIIKAHNPHVDDILKRVKHRWANPVSRFMHTTPGKALGIGALGATAAGLYSYMKNRQVPQAEDYQLSPEERALLQQQMYGMDPKMGADTMKSVTIPRPPPVPRMSPPRPAVGNLPQAQRDSAAIGEYANPKTIPGQDALKEKKADMDPSLAALLAGGAGGLGGYMAGEHVVSPLLERREAGILEEIAKKQKSLDVLKHIRKATPLGMAALGAVTLAAVAAAKARADERSKMNIQQILAGRLQQYDPTNAGFNASEQVPMGAPYDQVYG